MTKFLRTATLQIKIRRQGGEGYEQTLTIKGLRISFSITKTLSSTPNSAVINIWNLSASKRNIIRDYGDEVSLYAGYERGAGEQVLYNGDTTAVSHYFDQPEITTVLECGDGDKYVNNKFFSFSFESGTSVREAITNIAQKMGEFPININFNSNLVYDLGFEASGMIQKTLTKACDYAGLQWGFQNGALQIIPKLGTNSKPGIPINAQTGMIGIPERYIFKSQSFYVPGPAVGWKVKTLLEPRIIPGDTVNINSNYLDFQGIFKVQTIKHNGDTFGANWESNLEVTQI